MDTTPKSKMRSTLIVGILVVLAVFFGSQNIKEKDTQELVPDSQLKQSMFDGLELSAHAAYVYDHTTGEILYEKNSTLPLPLASIVKVMTAIVALDYLPEDTVVTITPHSIGEHGDSGFIPFEQFLLHDLASFMLVASSNDAAEAIGEATENILTEAGTPDLSLPFFIDAMNRKAEALSLLSLKFNNATGLDEDATTAGGTGSARDLALLFEYAVEIHPSLFHESTYAGITISSLSGVPHTTINTNASINMFPHIIASKTGYTILAGGNLAMLFETRNHHRISSIVLGSTVDGRFTDSVLLAEKAEAYTQSIDIQKKK